MKIIIAFFTLNLLFSCTSCSSSDKTPETPIVETPVEPNPPIVINDPVTPITDVEALDLVQKECIKYFWEYAHPVSKLAKERYHTDDPTNDANIVTTGGSGFGLMTLIAGVMNLLSRVF